MAAFLFYSGGLHTGQTAHLLLPVPPSTDQATRPSSRTTMGVIFLTLYIDLIGFSIVFPLGPDLLGHYLKCDGQSGVLAAFLAAVQIVAQFLGKDQGFVIVLFGGLVSSVFSVLQFLFSPFWGGLSDRHGRRPVLLYSVAGTALGYLIWVFSGSFWLFILSRIVCGSFSGNLSVATAAVADITNREQRARAMGLVGAAFGLGLVTGPAIGAVTAHVDLGPLLPGLASLGLNPFSLPALIALGMSLVNLLWIGLRFKETLSQELQAESRAEERTRHPLRAILSLDDPNIRRTNVVAFIFSVSFVAMEMTVTFLAFDRFHFSVLQNGALLVFLGLMSILTQGVIVRRLIRPGNEIRILATGLLSSVIGLAWLAFATAPWMLYGALVFVSLGSGLVHPASTGLISLYCRAAEQGRILGIFRSLGSLSRAVTPVCAGVIYWSLGSHALYLVAAGLSLWAFLLSRSLTSPHR